MFLKNTFLGLLVRSALLASSLVLLAYVAIPAQASIAYGSINNFDTVNDTGETCHGFEIEIEDIHSSAITYTYDWNHYGVPRITEDNSNPLHPRVFVRYESAKRPDGTWAAFTSVPAGPILPTDGHQFTNPSVNFGGEHFGVGFYGRASAVKYSWLKDDGAGNLVFAGSVNISTPVFTYAPPDMGGPGQVQAVIVPPEPPAPPVLEFGVASWVKETRTATHNNRKVELRDLVSDDPNDPGENNWKNGEPDEVEVEWQLFQTDFNSGNGGVNGKIAGAPENLPNGDEVITRRYDFFKYEGPLDPETGEALVEKVGPDGIHGLGFKVINGVNVDLSTIVVVGDYIGAQMAGFDAAGQIGLIDHLQSGEVGVPYVGRSIVIGGIAPVVTTRTGKLPPGMSLNPVTGILAGTPTASGNFIFVVHSTDAAGGDVSATYTLSIGVGGDMEPAQITVTTSASPSVGGTTSGDGAYFLGDAVTVDAVANPGFAFANWTAGGTVVSTSSRYQFTAAVNQELLANFRTVYSISTQVFPSEGGTATGGGVFNGGDLVTVRASANPGYRFVNWTIGGIEASTLSTYPFTSNADRILVANFVPVHTVTTSTAFGVGGTTSGGGTFDSGGSVTVLATSNVGYRFENWTEDGAVVSSSAGYTFSAFRDRDLVAHFAIATSMLLTPEGETPTVLGIDPVNVCARVSVRDENGAGRAGVTVQFTVTGPNAVRGEAITSGDGSVVICFSATLPGENILTATLPETSLSDTLRIPLTVPAAAGKVSVAATSSQNSRTRRYAVNGHLSPGTMRAVVKLMDPALVPQFQSQTNDGYLAIGNRLALWGHGAANGGAVRYRVDLVRGKRGSMSVTMRDADGNEVFQRRNLPADVRLH